MHCEEHYKKKSQKGGENLILNQNSTTPIYIQIAAWLETEILKGNFKADQKVYSQYQLAEMLQINPATAAKGLTLLGDENILYDKRGLGKFVSKEAREMIVHKRKNDVLQGLIENIVQEAMHLDLDESELITMIQKVSRKLGGKA